MVGVAGFEPTTSPTPRVCASQAALYSDLKFGIVAKLYLILAFFYKKIEIYLMVDQFFAI